MAYVFQQLEDELDQQGQTNIFNPEVQGQQQGQTGQVKTETAPALNTNVAGPSGNQMQSATKTSNLAVAKAIGKTQNPMMLAQTQQKIKDSQQKLQDEANAYTSKAQSTSYAVGDEDLDKFVKGDEAAQQTTWGTLGKGQAQADRWNTTADLNLFDVDALQTDSGIMNAMKNQSGGEYTSGMGAFDVATLKRTPQFEELRKQMDEDRKALRTTAEGYGANLEKDANATLNAKLAADKQSIKDRLGVRNQALTAEQEAEARAFNEAEKARAAQFALDEEAAVRASLMGDVDARGRNMDQFYNDADAAIDANQFYNFTDATADDVTTQEEADMFNRIAEALGSSEMRLAGGGARAGTVDRDSMSNAYRSTAQGARAAKDRELQSEVDRIMEQIRGNSRSASAAERDNEMKAIHDSVYGDYKDVWGDVKGTVDPSQFTSEADWRRYAAASDINSLNDLNKQLGLQTDPDLLANAAGGQDTFNADGYKEALLTALKTAKTQRDKDILAKAITENAKNASITGVMDEQVRDGQQHAIDTIKHSNAADAAAGALDNRNVAGGNLAKAAKGAKKRRPF